MKTRKKKDIRYDVFISYRREGGQTEAKLIQQDLNSRGHHAFFDVESLRSGPFNESLYRVIKEADAFVLILPEHGLDRCGDPEDWVRKEIECAHAHNKRIIPIALRNFQFPEELPESLRFLPMVQRLDSNLEYFDAFMDKLDDYIREGQNEKLSLPVWALPAVIALIGLALLLVFFFRGGTPLPEKDPQETSAEVSQSDGRTLLIPGPALKKAVQDALKIGEREITGTDALKLINLTCSGQDLEEDGKIRDLTGLAEFPNLKYIFLDYHLIEDLSPLQGMTKLKNLYLNGNRVSDLTPLYKLTDLTALSLRDNLVTDIFPLRNMTELNTLILSGNKIEDLSPLKDLTLLESLYLADSTVSDISALAGMTKLHVLHLYNNRISDLSPLRDMTEMKDLALFSNDIEDIGPLENMLRLQKLSISFNRVRDISVVKNFPELEELKINGNPVEDYSVLDLLPASAAVTR